jgi:tetratricopeptide (TPR) repeat protein
MKKAKGRAGRKTSFGRTPISIALTEKYYHSLGAALHDEGKLAKAIGYFGKAIDLADQPFTHYHLSLAYRKKGDLKKAFEEMGTAIALNPFNPQYYYQRSLMWRQSGNRAGALDDLNRAIELDANYARIREIRAAAKTIDRFLESDAKMVAWCKKRKPENRELQKIIRNLERPVGNTLQALNSASCMLPCPAYCCHFSGETILHGVHVGPWKLMAIRNFIREKGIAEKDVLRRLPFEGERLARLISPQFVIKERGCAHVYFPRRTGSLLTKALLKDLPRGREYRDLAWINEHARACTFLQEGRCVIHDLGGEPSLPACKEFLCFTGFVFALLRHLGLVTEGDLRTRSMADLNRIAVEALLILARELYANQDIMRMWTSLYRTLKAAVRADRERKDDGETADWVRAYNTVRKQYTRAVKVQHKRAGKQIRALVVQRHRRAPD